jgi:hypothetical protein
MPYVQRIVRNMVRRFEFFPFVPNHRHETLSLKPLFLKIEIF